MARRSPVTDTTRRLLTDALGGLDRAKEDADFLRVIGHPASDEVLARHDHYTAVIKAGLEYDRKAREGET